MEKNRNILVLTTISSAFLGFIVPLILWFVHKEYLNEIENKYLTNLLNFELTLLIIGLILTVINIVPILGQLISGLGYLIIWLINIIIIIKATIKLTKEETPKFPFVIELLK